MNLRQILLSILLLASFNLWWVRTHKIGSSPLPVSKKTANVELSDQLTDLPTQFAELKLSLAESILWKSPDVNELERKLKEATISASHKLEGAELLEARYAAQIKKNPAGGIAAIKSLLDKLSTTEFPVDRAALIDLASQIPGQAYEAKLLAQNELLNVIFPTMRDPDSANTEEELDEILSSNRALFIPMNSHAVLMRLSQDSEEALHYTIAGFIAQQDPNLRELLIDQFLEAYPDSENRLNHSLRTRGYTR